MTRIVPLIVVLLVGLQSQAGEPKQLIDVAYGSHPRQVLDFYRAKSDKPTPVVFYIHGGGWRGGDKKTNPQAFLDKGISVAAINYRYTQNGVEDKVEPPVAPMRSLSRFHSAALERTNCRARAASPNDAFTGGSTFSSTPFRT